MCLTRCRLFLIITLGTMPLPPAPASPQHASQPVLLAAAEEDGGAMGELIASLGYEPQVVNGDIASGRVDLERRAILIFASGSAGDETIRGFLENERQALAGFVSRGGCVIMFAQDARRRPLEDWLAPGMALLRGGAGADSVGCVDREHPLFSDPCAISRRRLNDAWYDGPAHADTFRLVARGRVVAARDAAGTGPWCAEYGWGLGRAVFYACEPEKHWRGTPEERRMARDVVDNALAYGVRVVRRSAERLPEHARVEKTSAGFSPQTWDDAESAEKTFAAEVDAAVDRAAAAVLRRQNSDGSFGAADEYAAGRTALALRALLAAGVSKHKPAVSAGIDYLVTRFPASALEDGLTYNLSLIMMALEARAAPLYERFELQKLSPEERERFEIQRDLSAGERFLVQRCRDFLVAAQLDNGYWTYTKAPSDSGGDLSNTQFAILGLSAASKCDIEAPAETWVRAIEGLLASQASSGAGVSFPSIVSSAGGAGPKFYVFPAEARPWGYRARADESIRHPFPDRSEATGSRAAMGASSLLIAFDALSKISRADARRLEGGVSRSVRDGLAWLWERWSVFENPAAGALHHFYYLYALERAGSLSGRRFIGDRDWYREGAAFLLGRQEPDGTWSDLTDTCFALLFLKRSTPPPIYTPGR